VVKIPPIANLQTVRRNIMKQYLKILVLFNFAFLGCSQPNNEVDKNTEITNSDFSIHFPKPKHLSLDTTNDFIKLFKPNTSRSIHINSPCYNAKRNKYEGEFAGQKIPKRFYSYFNFDTILSSNLSNGAEIFSSYRLGLTDSITALIVRRRSQYSETAIDLYFWDNKKNKITEEFELADSFGDGGWYFIKDAWLTDLNNDGLLDLINRKKDFWIEEEEEQSYKAGEPLPHYSDSTFVYLGNGENFIPSKIKVDLNKFKVNECRL
jgi:hypothetical protein